MKKYLPSPLAFMIMLVVAIFAVFVADAANGTTPENVFSFIDEFGRACTVYKESLDCDFDPCEPCYVSTPNPTMTPIIPPPLPTSTPEATPTPIPRKREKANCGLGNFEEGGDPNDHACGDTTGEENEPSGPPGQR